MTTDAEPLGTVMKWGAPVQMSTEAALAAGIITWDQAIAQGWQPPLPVPRLRRWRYALTNWWHDHRPTLHLGPCDHEDCW